MLTFVDVKFTSIVDVEKIKSCSGLQIYSKQQMLSVELSSCYVFRQQFVVKRVKCSADCSAIFVFTTQPHPQVLSVNGALTCNSNSQEKSFSKTTNKQSQTKEIGRCNQTTKDNRHYPFCGSNIIEDEVLFLFR